MCHWKDCILKRDTPYYIYVYIYLCKGTYDTGHSFEPIFMKFAWFVWVHPWVNPIVFENSRPDTTTGRVENVAPNRLSAFFQLEWVFLRKNLKTVFGSPSPLKRLYSFLSSDPPFPQKWSCPQKIIFRRYFGKILLFLQKLFNMKILSI